MNQSKWFVISKPVMNAKIRLFCFPYAGGSAQIYHNWAEHFSDSIEVIAIQPPGRGNRLFEKAYQQMTPLIEDLIQEISSYLDLPFAFFGHSMGARIAFELLNELDAKELPLPFHFFASGSRGPGIKSSEPHSYLLPKQAFLDKIKALNGTPDEILQNKGLIDFFIPLLRADFELAESHQFNGKKSFGLPLTLLTGSKDELVSQRDSWAWLDHFNAYTNIVELNSGHFFINEKVEDVIRIVEGAIREAANNS